MSDDTGRARLVNLGDQLQPKRWWFVFGSAADDHWWTRLLKPGFSHCFAFGEIAEGICVIINPAPGRVEIFSLEVQPWQLLDDMREAGQRVVVAENTSLAHNFVRRGPVMTCATHIAYTTGVPFLGVTPYQLFKRLMRLGGEELWAR